MLKREEISLKKQKKLKRLKKRHNLQIQVDYAKFFAFNSKTTNF